MEYHEMGVTELTERITADLKNDSVLSNICVRGEISNFKYWNPHAYFSLKEGESLVNCVMFNAVYKLMRQKLEDGTMVKAYGYIRVYAKRGTYQLYVENLESGKDLGELYRRFEELKRKLNKEGIFSKPKKQIPRFPRRIAVVASRSSAAFQDVLKTVRKRYPLAIVELFHSGVQGRSAVPQMVRALSLADKAAADVVLLVRGGGSIEDLWNFNEEAVVRKVYEMKTPVITGVGHEVDTTLVDYVSDLRAPTPTGAAEMATPDLKEVGYEIDRTFGRFVDEIKSKLAFLSSKLDREKRTLDAHSPSRVMELKKERVERAFDSLFKSMNTSLEKRRHALKNVWVALKHARAQRDVELFSERVENDLKRLKKAVDNILERKVHTLREIAERLKASNPNAPLKKGYAIVFRGKKVMTRAKDVVQGDKVDVLFEDGKISACVEEVQSNERKENR